VPGAWAAVGGREWHLLGQIWAPAIATMKDDVVKRRFIWAGLTAWTLLAALAATSPVVVLRWMGGKNWRRLHWGVYTAGVAAVVHFWWLVKPGVLRPMRPTLVLAILLGARVVWWARARWAERQRQAA